MAIPNLLNLVTELSLDYPVQWKNAHTGNAHTEDFIRLLAWEASKVNERFGLNGKRGNYNDVSNDVLNYFGEGVGHDPKTNAPITVIDVILGAGGPNPKPAWQPFDNPIEHAGPGGWIRATDPFIVGAPSAPPSNPGPTQANEPYPDEPTFWTIYTTQVKERYVGGKLDDEAFRWFTRPAYMIGRGMSPDEAAFRALSELDALWASRIT